MPYDPPNSVELFYGDLGAGGGIDFNITDSYTSLWNKKPEKRPRNPLGSLDPQAFLIAQAAGARPAKVLITAGIPPVPGPGTYNLEYRATIRGGLAALKLAKVPGYEKVNVDKLESKYTLQSNADDAALLRLVKGRDLEDGAAKMRKIVKKHGLERAAFGLRARYILANNEITATIMKGVSFGLSFVPGANVAGLVLGARSAVLAGFTQRVVKKVDAEIKTGLAEAAPAIAKQTIANPMAVNLTPEQAAAADLTYVASGPFGLAPSYFGIPTTPLLIGGTVITIGLLAAVTASLRSRN